MLKKIHERIKDFYVGRTPVGGLFLLALIAIAGLAALAFYWSFMDVILPVPRWVEKVALLVFAAFLYGRYSLPEKKEISWLKTRDYYPVRVELEHSDLGLVAGEVLFGMIGRTGDNNHRYVELSGTVETVGKWRDALKAAKRPYRYVTAAGWETGNDPKWVSLASMTDFYGNKVL
ncbi:hypothetical protein [Paraburkholderia saeva]|uniref:Uncharacterized protein n=1 Tax=Paraburkholderia saeva TaxID=2777537 RepID=A0A9N8RYX3_9BURK|nr:hypothetical protein [Paraburkholderia saeva]CAG4905767.1 hypothetical protein LMG31841_03485 [Paraburkholderia saeva]